MEKCSKLFSDVFDSGCGGCYRECSCGKIYYDTYNTWDWEPGEFEELEERAKKEPNKYIPFDCAVGTISIGGVEFVYGCECGGAKKYEDFIISHAYQIAQYLNKRSEKLREASEQCKVQQTAPED